MDNEIIIYCLPDQKHKIFGCLCQGTFCVFKKAFCERTCDICIEKHIQFRDIRDLKEADNEEA